MSLVNYLNPFAKYTNRTNNIGDFDRYEGIDFEYGKEEDSYLYSDPLFKLFKYLQTKGFNVYKKIDPIAIYDYKSRGDFVLVTDCDSVDQMFGQFEDFLIESSYNTVLLYKVGFMIESNSNGLELKALIHFSGVD